MKGAGGATAMAVAVVLICCSAVPSLNGNVIEQGSADQGDRSVHSVSRRNVNPSQSRRADDDDKERKDQGSNKDNKNSGGRGPSGGMDEIDISPFPIGNRRSDLSKSRRADDDDKDRKDQGSNKDNTNSGGRGPSGGMDEIDNSQFPIGSRRSVLSKSRRADDDDKDRKDQGSNKDNTNSGGRGPSGGMDEIDNSQFPIGSRRSVQSKSRRADDDDKDRKDQDGNKDNKNSGGRGPSGGMDEIDNSQFPIGSRRSVQSKSRRADDDDKDRKDQGSNKDNTNSGGRGPSGGMDEIDNSQFPIGSRRSVQSQSRRADDDDKDRKDQDGNKDNKNSGGRGPSGGMDEIDNSQFPIGSRRSLDN